MIRSLALGGILALGALGCSDDAEPANGPSNDPILGPPVTIEGLTCDHLKNSSAPFPVVMIGGREVIIDYPCDKPSGSPMTFVLHLHGTQNVEALKIYQRSYLRSPEFVDSHNLIVATPKSVVSQWGNGDGGQDDPHILETIDWVYDTFQGFDIVNMWIAGHSWGAVHTNRFICRPELELRVNGAILMSGSTIIPPCADRLALIGTVGETDIIEGELDQGAVAAAHGCDAQQVTQLGNNRVTEWPNCDPGWVHKSYFMLGKGHGFDPIDWPDEGMVVDIADALVKVREGS